MLPQLNRAQQRTVTREEVVVAVSELGGEKNLTENAAREYPLMSIEDAVGELIRESMWQDMFEVWEM